MSKTDSNRVIRWNSDPTLIKIFQEGPRSSIWKKDYDKTRRFRDEWLEKFPWVQRDPDGDRFGYCPHCNIKLEPKAKRLEDHERTTKHLKNSGTKLSALKRFSGRRFRGRKRKFRRVSFEWWKMFNLLLLCSIRREQLSAQNHSTEAWSSLVEGGEGSYLPNCQTTLVIALDALFLLFCIFINTTAYHWADTSLHLLLRIHLEHYVYSEEFWDRIYVLWECLL